MQTVTSQLSSSTAPATSLNTNGSDSKDSQAEASRGQLFSENLQQAKKTLETDSRSKPVKADARDDAATGTSSSKTSTSSKTFSSDKSSTSDAPIIKRDSSHTALLEQDTPDSRVSVASQVGGVSGKVLTSESALVNDGNKLQAVGQKSPNTVALEKSAEPLQASDTQDETLVKSAIEEADASGGKSVTNAMQGGDLEAAKNTPVIASQSTPAPVASTSTSTIKNINADTVVTSAATSVGQTVSTGQAIPVEPSAAAESSLVPLVDGKALSVSADPKSVKEQGQGTNQSQIIGAEGKSESLIGLSKTNSPSVVTHSDADIRPLKNAEKIKNAEKTDPQSSVVNNNVLHSAAHNALSNESEGVDSPAVGVLAEGNVKPDAEHVVPVSGQSTNGISSALDVKAMSDKVPAEVRALYASKADTAAGLAAIGGLGNSLADKKSSPVVTSGNHSTGQSKAAVDANTEEAAQGSELSWVLSQMGASTTPKGIPVPASAGEQGGAATTASSLAPMAANKVADQVAVANATKGAQTAVAPLFLANADQSDGGAEVSTDLAADSIVGNEPIELRKKEQDALIGKMAAQVDGLGKDADSGGLNSSISSTNNVANRPSPALSANPQTLNGQQNLTMSVPPNHAGWAGEMSQKVAWVAQGGGHSAHIKLDPPELGSLTVKVSVDSDNNNTQVSFVAATPQARDLLESQMGRLRDMLAQQGMDLGNVDVGVSQQDTSGNQYQGDGQEATGSGVRGMLAADDTEETLVSPNISYVSPSGVDYYA